MPLTTNLSLMVLRWVTAGALLYFHVWWEAKAGYLRVWREVPWPLIDQVRGAGFPQPLILASVGAALAFLACGLLILGLLTRVAAGTLLVVLLFVVIACLRAGNWAGVEVCLLYGICCFLLLVHGAGRFGIDGIFAKPTVEEY